MKSQPLCLRYEKNGCIMENMGNNFQVIEHVMKDYNERQIDAVDSILKLTTENTEKETKKLKDFLNNECCYYSQKKKEIYNEHDIDGSLKFNFFESISDLYYREKFHSDILEVILNPNTKEIGRNYFMQEFVNFLGLKPVQFDCSAFEVIKENPTGKIKWVDNNGKKCEKEGYIDLLIKNKNQAIIVENKINYAPDMDNQLVRYMKYVKEVLKIEIYTVVYMTLKKEDSKRPPIDSYDKDFIEYTNQLKNNGILKEVYAVADQGTKSLENNFLPNCQERLRKESEFSKNKDIKQAYNTANVYIEQYRLLLKHLGGEAYMSQTDKDTIRDIFSSKEKLETALDFMEIWNNREDECIRNSDRKLIESIKADKEKLEAACTFEELWNNRTKIFADCIVDALQNKGFVVRDETTVFKKLDDDISLSFWNGRIPRKDEYYYAYGFTVSDSEKIISEKKAKKLKVILQSNILIKMFGYDASDEKFAANEISFDKIEANKILIKDFIDNLIDQFDLLEKKYKSTI